MTDLEINEIVSAHLAGQPEQYLQDVVDHGIHNVCNGFGGDSDKDFEAFAAEFRKQAGALLASLGDAS